MVKLRFPQSYTQMLAEKFMELGNLAVAGIVFAQLLPDQRFSGRIALLGLVTFLLVHSVAYYLMRGGAR